MRVTSRGFGIHYTVDGDGPPLVLLAGTMLAARHWEMLGYVEALAREWRVIDVDPLGHGHSDGPHDPSAYTAAGVTADILAVLDAEGVERATVWGYSRGGWLACAMASRHPERVERIVVGGFAMHAHEAETSRMLVPMAGFLRRSDWAGVWRAFGVTDAGLQRTIEDGNDPLAVAAAIDGSMDPTRFVDPTSITCSAHYYVGSADWIVPHVEADVAAIGSSLDVISGQTHLGAFFAAVQPVLSVVTSRLVGRPL
jgi:pimeloyl-ACP methyl ester carboxylesterase